MAAFRREHFGSEPPGPGWNFAGEAKWSREGPRIAVVGGGPGGLFTAYLLGQRYPEAIVTLFEASDRLGGKIRTDQFPDGTPFEAGVAELYEYLGPGGKDALRQLIEDDLALPTVDMSGGGVVLGDKLVRRPQDLTETFSYETWKHVERFYRRMTELMPLEKYVLRWQPDNKHPWASKTFRDCIREEIPDDPVAVAYVETAVHSDLATEPWTCNGLNGIKNVLMDNEDYLRLYHVVGGIERVSLALEAALYEADTEIYLDCRVTGIEREGERYRMSWRGRAEDYSRAFDAVVVALPNHWLGQLRFGDEQMREAVQKMLAHYDLPAHYYRVTYRFSRNWWEKHQIPGDFWMMDLGGGCCVYNEAHRWRRGNCLSFLLGGQDALLQVSANQSEEDVARALLEGLPPWMRRDALETVEEYQVDAYAGSVNAQPGGWPAEELRGEHCPEPEGHPGIFFCGDYFVDSTLNAALISASVAVELLLDHFGEEGEEGTPAVRELGTRGAALGLS